VISLKVSPAMVENPNDFTGNRDGKWRPSEQLAKRHFAGGGQ